MTYSTGTLLSKDKLELGVSHWGLSKPKALICLIHGLGEHAGRYDQVAKAFNEAGYALLAIDHRGHGSSQGKRGVIPSYSALMSDVSTLLAYGKELYATSSQFLYGHSMGGNIVINYGLTQTHDLMGIIATSPALKISSDPFKAFMTNFLNVCLPSLTLPNGLDSAALSRRPDVVLAYQQDPLVHDRISVKLAHSLIVHGKRANQLAHTLQIPLLLMHGSADRICLPEGSQSFAQQAGEFCEFRLWDGLYHELHNEPERELVLQSMIDWLNEQMRIGSRGGDRT